MKKDLLRKYVSAIAMVFAFAASAMAEIAQLL